MASSIAKLTTFAFILSLLCSFPTLSTSGCIPRKLLYASSSNGPCQEPDHDRYDDGKAGARGSSRPYSPPTPGGHYSSGQNIGRNSPPGSND